MNVGAFQQKFLELELKNSVVQERKNNKLIQTLGI
jgi:hypothetical protein